MYPTIIREFRISPEKEKEVIPSFIKDCIELRKHYKKEYEETKDKKYDLLQYALKILSNATYGYLLANFTRLYNEELGNMVTGYGRYILTLMVQYFEKCNLDVIAGDTDSCFVVMPNKDINIAITHRKGVEDYIKAKVNRDFTIELSRVYDKLFISGVKKRYVGYISYEDGEKLKEKKFDVVGFEIIRGDAFPLLKEVQEELFNLVLNSKNIDEIKDKGIEILKKYYKEMKKGKLDDKLCISVNRFKRMPKLSKSGKVIQTRQLKVLKKLEEKNIILPPTEKISYIVCDKKCEPIPFINNKLIENKKPNYDYYLERLANVAERILNISSSELCKLVKEEAIRGLENYVK
jgi:DNA polymerase I